MLRDVRRSYGEVRAVNGIDLAIARGEFFTLLGPSGSGKTTTLRLIAGFEQPDGGSIELGGVDVTRLPPHERDVNTVFQDYALFPHMTVIENVEYGLRVKRVGRQERRRRAEEALGIVRLPGLGARKPAQLSGGQRQRVALARALVNRPAVLLLDEPLGALDLKLRQEMQLELKRIQRELGAGAITFVFVTHDQDEALTMSDRIAVFNEGAIEQVGTPAEVYEHPDSAFVAGFVGVSNMLERDGRQVAIRPEKIHMRDDDGGLGEGGRVRDVVYLGMVTRYLIVELDAGGELQVVEQNLETSSQGGGAQGPRAAHSPAVGIGAHACHQRGRRRVVRRIRRAHVLLAVVTAALCIPAASVGKANGLPTSIGKGEGQLNLIAWEGYAQPQWVTPFEKATGCQVNAKYAGSSDEMVALMSQGGDNQYDLVSASGDASLRLIYSKLVQPVNVNLVPSWKQFPKTFQSPPNNTVNGVHYGISLQWGPNTPLYNTKLVTPAPTSWASIYSAKYSTRAKSPSPTTRSRSPTRPSTSRRLSPRSASTIPTSSPRRSSTRRSRCSRRSAR